MQFRSRFRILSTFTLTLTLCLIFFGYLLVQCSSSWPSSMDINEIYGQVISTYGKARPMSKGRDEIPEWAADKNTVFDIRDRQVSIERNQTPEKTVSSDGEDANGQRSDGGTSTERAVIPTRGITRKTMVGDKSNIVLVWHWPYGNAFSVDYDFCKVHFDVSNCILVANRSQFPEADLVVFHNWEIARTHTEELPVNLTRPEKQRWVWLTRESPLFNGNVKPLNGYFNLTMTYRRDSDIYTPYGLMVPKDTVSDEPLENFIPKNKTKLVCWVVSNFKPKHLRTTVYNKLKAVIPIEVYGKAGNRKISQKDLSSTISRCFFYLTFENSVYKDYITEKLWYNAYRSGAVPVVLGPSREDYEAVADKDSFIHVNDFNTVEELGQFLKELAQDKERYAAYFNWRRKYNAMRKYWTESLCKFCPQISSLPPHKVYDDLDAWQNV